MPFPPDGRRGLRAAEGSGGARAPRPERRQLTVMFCDLVGSTALSRSMDPEDLLDVPRSYRDACSKIIADHGGYVSRYMGDGMLALFGYPVAEENNTERAAYAALAIAEAVPALRVPGHDELRLSVRLGMATGMVIAGDVIGEGASREEAIFGETPNLAARLQSLAAPNTVIISDNDLPPEASPALAAIDAAIMDWVGKSKGMPLYRLHRIDPSSMPPTSMSIAIDSPEQVQKLAREARNFSILKLKLGGPQDRSMIQAIRNVTDVPIRGDANEGYADRETALREIEWLASHNVELIEQPLPANRLEDMAWLKERSPLPLIADEGFSGPDDLPDLEDAYHGINIKLVKSGGTLAALTAIREARRHGLSVMLGSTLESSLGIAAAAHLAPLADHADLDGNLLLANDPFIGHPIENGRIVLNDRPGLGLGDPVDH